MEIFIQVFWLLFGFLILIKGADLFVEGASGVAKRFGIPPLIVGLTIVAMGTSLPEAAISISAALKGSAGIAVGNALGSNILNVLLILGISAAILPITVQRSVTRREIPFLLLVSVLLPLLGLLDGELSRVDGVILWILFLAYLAWLFRTAKKSPEKENPTAPDTPAIPMWRLCGSILLGGAMVMIGSDDAVNAATAIAKVLGMSDRLIGLTIIALGTSLPELMTGIMAAKKGNADMALGNVVGSNLFNVLFVLGTSALITPVAYPAAFMADSVIHILTCILLLSLLIRDAKLQRSNGFIMLACFAGYYVWLFLS